MAPSGKNISKVSRRMRRGQKPVNMVVTAAVQVESLDLDAQGIAEITKDFLGSVVIRHVLSTE